MKQSVSRRDFLKNTAFGAAALGAAAATGERAMAEETVLKRPYKISLAGWSLHRTIGEGEDKVPMLDMPKLAQQEFGIGAIELVSTMLASEERSYLDELAKNAADNDVKLLLVMVDGQGEIGHEDESERKAAVSNHKRWIDHADYLGCHSIRMNWRGAPEGVVQDPLALAQFVERSAGPLQDLCEYGESKGINVLIENHGGPSSHPSAVTQLVKAVDHPRFGTLPDFGNFPAGVDVYYAVDELMEYAKAVSAKCYDFDPDTGMETKLDYPRLIQIVTDKHGYDGYIGIEYEGSRLSEYEGIKACKKLLERLRTN